MRARGPAPIMIAFWRHLETTMLRTICVTALLCASLGYPARAQHSGHLRDLISDLFTFGDCGQPLCLDGSINADNGHGDHYLPAVASGNLAVISFISDAIGKSVARTPVSATSSGATFSFVGGIPVRNSTSGGPIVAERAQTLGRGRLFLGANVSGVSFTTLGGISTDRLELNFVHQDVDPSGLGDPLRENDIIRLDMALDINVLVSSLFFTYGVTDFIDLGLFVPFVRTSIRGSSEAQIEPFGSTAVHFFSGTIDDPVLNASASIKGSSAGIGDIAARLKVNLGQSDKIGAAILGDARFPTGDEEELLGSGSGAVRALGILSAQFGDFSPHLNAGYLVRTGETSTDAALATVGFDHLMAPWATLAVDILSEWQVGENPIELPGPINIDQPFARRIRSTSITATRDDIVEASAGMKFTVRGGTVIVTNVIIPLTDAGLQADAVWTTGLEFSF